MGDPFGFAVSYLSVCMLTFLWGACIGSFLNVCIWRIPRGESVIAPRSHCLSCGTTIAWYDNIPMLSFILLGRKCRKCGVQISWRYLAVEYLTAIIFLLVWLKFAFLEEDSPALGLTPLYGNNLALVPIYWLGAAGLIFGSFVDVDHMIIPDRVSIGGIVAGILLSAFVPAMHGQETMINGLLASVISAAFGFILLWSIAGIGRLVFRRDAMGFGDVKLMGAIGAFLGWRAVLFTLIISSFLGAAFGLSLVALKKKELRGRIPYGPFIAIAAILWMLWGRTAWNWYASFFVMPVEDPLYGGFGVP